MKDLILVIEDELLIRQFIERILEEHFSVLSFSSVEQALPHLEQSALIVSDFQMPGLGGAGLIEHLRQTQMRPLLIVSGLGREARELRIARELGIPILGKPFTPNELLGAVKKALQTST